MLLIKQWLCTYRHEHECIQQEIPITQVGGVLNVIDCHENTVVAAPANCQYLALSYVWGRRDVLPFSQAPQAVLDAMRVTMELGQGYLWVDKSCILAADEDMKQYQPSLMDQVYSSAFSTIVAAAGISEDHELCGIRRARANAQPSAMLPETDGLRLIGEIRGTKKSVYDSV